MRGGAERTVGKFTPAGATGFGTSFGLTLAASSCALRAAIAAAAFGSGGGIGLPSLVCNFTTCSNEKNNA